MTTTPWLSVVIPVFRAEDRIADAIASVTAQRVEGVEIICVDDCSPDQSADVVTGLVKTDSSITLVSHETNRGPGPSRNTGIDRARGEYIVFLDADDSLVGGSLASLKNTVTTTPVDLVVVGCEEVRRGKARSLTDGPLWDHLLDKSLPTSVREEPRILFWPPAPWSKVYRRQFLDDHRLRFGSGMGEDIPWSARVTLLADTVAACPTLFYRYVTAEKDSSVTTTQSDRALALVAQVRAIRENTPLENWGDHVASHLSALVAIHLIWANRAAYRLLPEELHERFFADSVTELSWWLQHHAPPPSVDSRPLMSGFDRDMYTRALASGDVRRWHTTLEQQKKATRFRRVFLPGRGRAKKS